MSDSLERDPAVQPLELSDDDLIDGPPLPGTVVAATDRERVFDRLGADLVAHAMNCVRSFGDFHLALSGGSTPLPFYERLMIDPAFRMLPWTRTHLWIVDERRVPFDDDKSNFRAISEVLHDHSGIPPEQVHPMLAMRDDADEDYERTLRETLAWREKGHDRLDYVLLGMGDDGHTASLFPESPALDERKRLVRINDGERVVPPARVTMTYPLINAARFVAILALGAKKAAMIDRIATGDDDERELPIKGVRPVGGELRWYLDAEACGQ